MLNHALTQADRPDFTASRNGYHTEPDTRPVIALSGKLPELTAAAWSAILAANAPPSILRYGGSASRIERDDKGVPLVRLLTQDRMRHVLARVARWLKPAEHSAPQGDAASETFPPMAVVRDVLATADPPLPVLSRIVQAPVLTRSGRVIQTEGYDAETGILYLPADGLTIPPVPEAPSPGEIGHAVHLLRDELLGDFCFVGAAERAHAVTLVLLPFLRDAIDGPVPLYLVEKSTPGTGATLLVNVSLFPALGRDVDATPPATDEAEWRKKLTAVFVEGAPSLFLDNLRAPLDSGALSAALTAPLWSDRPLGRTETVRAPVRCIFVASGNNPSVSLEIARRTARIRLDAKVEEPWLRSGFRHDPLRTWVRDHRGQLVAAALTLGRAWFAAGCPTASTPVLGMFESWSHVMGGVLAVAGLDGFLGNLDEFYRVSNTEGEETRAFLGAWWEQFKDGPVTTADLLQLDTLPSRVTNSRKNDTLQGRASRLGHVLKGLRDRHVTLEGGRPVRIEYAGTRQGASVHRLIPGAGA